MRTLLGVADAPSDDLDEVASAFSLGASALLSDYFASINPSTRMVVVTAWHAFCAFCAEQSVVLPDFRQDVPRARITMPAYTASSLTARLGIDLPERVAAALWDITRGDNATVLTPDKLASLRWQHILVEGSTEPLKAFSAQVGTRGIVARLRPPLLALHVLREWARGPFPAPHPQQPFIPTLSPVHPYPEGVPPPGWTALAPDAIKRVLTAGKREMLPALVMTDEESALYSPGSPPLPPGMVLQ